MSVQSEPINLTKECGPMPSGKDLAGYDGYSGNLILTIEGVLSWSGPMKWGIRVEKPTVTASGRKGKPRKVVMLVADEGQTPADLLRNLARMWEAGDVVPGESYPVSDGGEVTDAD